MTGVQGFLLAADNIRVSGIDDLGAVNRAAQTTPTRRRYVRFAPLVVLAIALAGLALSGCASTAASVTATTQTVTPTTVQDQTVAPPPTPIPDSVVTTAQKSIMSIGCQDANNQMQFEGTAFMVAGPAAASAAQTSYGKAITASHVVSACGTGSTVTATGPVDVSLLQNDATHDLALLSISGELESPLPIETAPPHVGEQVALLGEAHQEPEVTQGTITAVNIPQTLGGEGSTETLSDSIQVQTSIIAGESGGPAIDGAGKVVGVVEGGSQTGSSAVLTPVSDLPAGSTDAPPAPQPTTTTSAPGGCNCGVADLPNRCDANIASTSDISCRIAETTFHEYWKATGGNASGQVNVQAWSPADQQYYTESCSSGDGVVDCTPGHGSDVRFNQSAIAAYTPSEASAYAASTDLGPNG